MSLVRKLLRRPYKSKLDPNYYVDYSDQLYPVIRKKMDKSRIIWEHREGLPLQIIVNNIPYTTSNIKDIPGSDVRNWVINRLPAIRNFHKAMGSRLKNEYALRE